MFRPTFLTALIAIVLFAYSANAQVLIHDTFGDGDPQTNTDGTVAAGVDGTYWAINNGGGNNGEVTESGGAVTLDPSANGNWARAELLSNNDFPFPGANTTTSVSWTIGPVLPLVDVDGDDYRVQFSVNNVARSQTDPATGTGRDAERWVIDGQGNGEAAMSLDLFFDQSDTATGAESVEASFWEKDSTWPANDDASLTGPTDPLTGWDWLVDSNTFTLAMNETTYEWSDSVAGWSSGPIPYGMGNPTGSLATDMANGFWAYTHGQNRDGGRGLHEMTEFSVVNEVVPEPFSGTLSLLAALGLFVIARRR